MLIKTLCQGISQSFLSSSFPNVYAARGEQRKRQRKDDSVLYIYALKRQRFTQVRSQRDTSLLNSLPELDKNVYARTACSC